MDRRKLSSDKTHYAKKIAPLITVISYVGLLVWVIIDELYIVLPVFLLFLVGIIIGLLRNRKIVDCFVNYDTREIILDNLGGKIFRYKFSDLISVRHHRFRNYVRLRFTDGKSYIFPTRNFMRLVLFEKWDNIDVDLERILKNRFADPVNNDKF